MMEKAVAVANGGKKHGVGVVEPTLALISLAHRGIRGGCKNGNVEGGVLTFGKGVRKGISIVRKVN